MVTRVTLLILAAFVLGGCERPSQAPPKESDHALEKAINEPLDRAKAVEGEIMEAKKKTDEQIEEQTGG